MAGEEMAKRDGERRRSRAGSNLNVNFNSGGVVLLLGAAAGALLASAFAAHRVRAHKKTRGSITDGSQGDSGEHLASRETKDFASDEAGEGNGANAGEGAVQVIVRKKSVQVNSHESLDASVQISQVDLREIDFYLLEEGKGEVAERGPTTDIELVDGDHRKLAGCRDSLSADISSSPPNVYRELGISNSLGENQISCDDEELVAASINEKHKNSFLNCKEDDEEGTKKVYLEERSEREEAEEKLTSSNQFSEQPRLIEKISGILLHPLETLDFVEDIEEVEGGANMREQRVQVSAYDDLYSRLEILDFVKIEPDIYLVRKVPEISSAKEIELVDGVKGELACLSGSRAKIGSAPANIYNNLGVDSSSREDQLSYGNEQLLADSVREEGEAPYINIKEEEDSKKAFVEEWIEREELGEKVTQNLNTEEHCLLEKKCSQNLEMVMAIDERQLEDGFKDEIYNSILEFVHSRANETATSSYFGDQYEMNPLIEELELFFYGSREAKQTLDMTQIDSGKLPQMVKMEEEIRVESHGFKDAVTLDILCVEKDNENGDASDDKMLEGVRVLREETVALPHDSSFTAISELETSSPKDSIMVLAEGDVQLIAYTKGIIHIEEDKIEVEKSNCPSDEGVEGLIDEIQGTESCIRDNPAMITAVEEKTQVEDNVTTEENMLNGFIENVESSETEDNLRENEKCPITKSQRIEFSLERDNLMACKEILLIQFQGIEPVVREEKAWLEDQFPLSLESNMKIVQPIQDNNNLSNSEKTLEREECHLEADAEELGTSLNEEIKEWEHEISSVHYHELDTRQYSEAHKDKLEREIEYPQVLPVVKKVDEIHKESEAQITEEVEEKLSFDLVEKGVNMVAKTIKQDTKTELIDLDRKHQRQVEGHENNVPSKGNQQRIATKRVNGIEYMFMGYPKGHFFLVMTLAIAFAVLAFLHTKDVITRISIFQNFV